MTYPDFVSFMVVNLDSKTGRSQSVFVFVVGEGVVCEFCIS